MEVINVKKPKYPNIAAERARRGMTTTELGDVVGVTRKTILNWETKGAIPQEALEKLADYFGCSVEYLLAS